ncbi:MAG: lipase family protein [Verrucomicrobiota bacterium]
MALISSLSYTNKTTASAVSKEWGFNKCQFISVKKKPDIDTQCLVLADDQNIIIAFRGSESAEDWFANFQAVTDPGPLNNTKAHEGFQDALYPTVIRLTETINRFSDNDQKLWITGHSLGGALCSLHAGMLAENGFEVYGIYTFASPRPGDKDFADELMAKIKGPHFRVINSGDVVPHVPPEPFFSHPGNRVILKKTTRTSTAPSWMSERKFVLGLFVKATGRIKQVLDLKKVHVLDGDPAKSYIPKLIKLVNKEA